MTEQFNAWNPGLESDIPRHLLPLVTLFRGDNGFVEYNEARELSDLTGIKLNDLVAFRPERLVIHILLVRVTADLSVADGPNYEELGLNLRGMVHTIYSKYMLPEMDEIRSAFDDEKAKVQNFISSQLSEKLSKRSDAQQEPAQPRSIISKLFGEKSPAPPPELSNESIVLAAIETWQQQAKQDTDQLHKSCKAAMAKTVGTIVGHRGAIRVDQQLITRIASNAVCNDYVAKLLDDYIEPIWNQALSQENYRRLPIQDKPVIMNVKGASASGKSTIRPQQRELAGKLNIPWDDFALISPDYWRKYLLDYTSLEDDYKYGAMLTGTELEIIDKKLDRYMAVKSSTGKMSHLLIDRFRFDSFTLDIDKSPDSRLLSRFGDQVFLFFVITPPAETVERAWLRGKETGRYKAVDDLLYHNVEAFTGMPSLFLSWVNSKDRRIHFEFLDNDVPKGELPRTAAFGWNGTMTILDVNVMLNIVRYRQVDITAKQTDQVLKSSDADIAKHKDFILQCSKTVSQIEFADQQSLHIYARVLGGKLVWWDDHYISNSASNMGLQQLLTALGHTGTSCEDTAENSPAAIEQEKEQQYLVGNFGSTTA